MGKMEKSEKQILKDKKAWIKSLRLWKKINNYVRIVETKHGFDVQSRTYVGLLKGMSEWESLNDFSSIKGAIQRRNMYIVMILMRDMGYQREFIKRRTARKKALGLI